MIEVLLNFEIPTIFDALIISLFHPSYYNNSSEILRMENMSCRE